MVLQLDTPQAALTPTVLNFDAMFSHPTPYATATITPVQEGTTIINQGQQGFATTNTRAPGDPTVTTQGQEGLGAAATTTTPARDGASPVQDYSMDFQPYATAAITPVQEGNTIITQGQQGFATTNTRAPGDPSVTTQGQEGLGAAATTTTPERDGASPVQDYCMDFQEAFDIVNEDMETDTSA
jgi:hypothetical protein